MSITQPGRNMLSGIGDAAERSVGTGASDLPAFSDLPEPVMASQAEAEAGTDATKMMSPQRVAQAVVALGGGIRRGGAGDTSTGSSVTITDLGGVSEPDMIDIWLDAVSVSGSDSLLIQIGDSGGVASSGYVSASGPAATSGQFTTSSNGFVLYQAGTGVWRGVVQLRRTAGNSWVCAHAMQASDGGLVISGGGGKTLSGPIDRISVTPAGANTLAGGLVQLFAGRAA
ncbi:MAG: hypothetical protein P1U37_09065 [Minwuia sp.]|nr:hypothetical protein [Minwuia sp.]